ncbi:recombinase family protein [Endozoicomonas sp. ALD040]|uniref:recombinase family protein n=1 Tax=Endozoicomonas sp. ALD040 TaxID=3403079 RepID=UPI003BAE5E24
MSEAAYIRVSSTDQNTERQYEIVKEGVKVFEDKCSGSTTNRPALGELKNWLREGDTVHVHSIDRMARDLLDLQSLVNEFNEKGVTVVFHKESLTFSSNKNDSMSKLMLQIFGAVAEFERARIKDRQAEGIAKAKAKGVYKGRKQSVDRDRVRELKAGGMGATAIAKELGIARKTVYRVLEEQQG